jgi:GntR family phosphonate transport system transcriptional regulator
MVAMKKRANSLIDRNAGVALWRQVADHIRHSIAEGIYDERMMLAPEKELAATLGVNRHTVRSAIATLASEGVVRPVQGIGTMIRPPRRIKLPVALRTRFSEGVGTQAKEAAARLLSYRIEPAIKEVAVVLGIKSGTDCLVLETTHSADGKPVSTATNWFEARRFEKMPERVQALGSISAALAACGVEDYIRLSTEISATHASGEDLIRLKLAAGAVVLETKAVNGDANGKPIQYARSRFDAGRASLVITFANHAVA